MVHYPNGESYAEKEIKQGAGGRGMNLEKDLNLTNTYYLETDKAVIYKKPTPVQVVKVDYACRAKAKITEAYYKIPSTIDYSGVYRGYHLDFEAKESRSKTSFPLSSIHKHQIDYIDNVIRHGAISFVIIRFVLLEETYLVEGAKIVEVYRNRTRESIPYAWFKENAYVLPFGLAPRIDYLKIVDIMISKEEEYAKEKKKTAE